MRTRLDRAFYRMYRDDTRIAQKSCCAYCGDRLTATSAMGDHVQPRKDHGGHGRENIVAACGPCNRLKGHMTVKQFRAKLRNPPTGDLRFQLRWAHKRINDRLARMERNLPGSSL